MAWAFALIWVVAALNAEFDVEPWWLDLLVGVVAASLTAVAAVLLVERDA